MQQIVCAYKWLRIFCWYIADLNKILHLMTVNDVNALIRYSHIKRIMNLERLMNQH